MDSREDSFRLFPFKTFFGTFFFIQANKITILEAEQLGRQSEGNFNLGFSTKTYPAIYLPNIIPASCWQLEHQRVSLFLEISRLFHHRKGGDSTASIGMHLYICMVPILVLVIVLFFVTKMSRNMVLLRIRYLPTKLLRIHA